MDGNLLLIILVGIGTVVFIFYKRYSTKINLWNSLDYRLLLVTVPKENLAPVQNESPKKLSELISPFEQFLSNLSSFKHPIILELATPSDSEEIIFYVSSPRRDLELLEKNLSAFYPQAYITEVDDYTIFEPLSRVRAGYIKQDRHYAMPLRTYYNFDVDTLSGVTNALSQLAKQNEGAAMQLVFMPVKKFNKKAIGNILKNLKEGKSFKEAEESQNFNWQSVWKIVNKQSVEKENEEKLKPKILDEVMIKALEEKLSKPLFQVNLRIVTAAENNERTEDIFDHIVSSIKQLEAPNLNSFSLREAKTLKMKERLIYNYAFRNFVPSEAMILNSAELASLYHLPHSQLETPKIKWLRARNAPAPVNLPLAGIILGDNIYRKDKKEVRIADIDRQRHLYILGQTGTGKTTLLENMLIQDIRDGKGVCYIDPHGDTAEKILGAIPENRYADLIYFNPADPKRAMGLNMLDYDKKYSFQKSAVTNELLDIFDKLYDLKTTGGPIFEQYFRNAMLLLLDDTENKHTLMDLPRIFINDEFRTNLLEKETDPSVVEFWKKEAEKAAGDMSLANVAPYINSKLNPFLSNDLVRPIIGQESSSLDFRKIMDEGKILIVNLSKGYLGDINSYLLGMIIIGKLKMAAFSRVDVPESERRDFYMYIDEFQNITTENISMIFSEARKYHLCLTVANQFLAQLKEPILKSVFGNVGTIISYRVSSDDADFMAKYFAPIFGPYDVLNLDNYNYYIKLTINGQTSKAFNVVARTPYKIDRDKIEKLKELSSLCYGREIAIINQEIKNRY